MGPLSGLRVVELAGQGPGPYCGMILADLGCRPWSSKFEESKEIGTFYCAACGNALFKSDTKFESGCGWPSFYEPISKSAIIYTPDNAHGMTRTEVQCGRCKSHLGHVFEDGPPPTGLRYCINGVVLDFDKAQKAEKIFKAENKE